MEKLKKLGRIAFIIAMEILDVAIMPLVLLYDTIVGIVWAIIDKSPKRLLDIWVVVYRNSVYNIKVMGAFIKEGLDVDLDDIEI